MCECLLWGGGVQGEGGDVGERGVMRNVGGSPL